MKNKHLLFRPAQRRAFALPLAFSLGLAGAAHAGTIYWDGATSATWNTAGNWSTASGAATPNPGAIPGGSDDVFFNISTANGNTLIALDNNRLAQSLTFRSTGTVGFKGNTSTFATRTLTIGTGGITLNSGAGAVTISTGANGAVNLILAGSQSIANNSSSTLTIGGTLAGTGSPTITNNGSGTGTVSFGFGAAIDNTVNKVVQDSATSLLMLRSTGNTFAGGVEIKKGTVSVGNASDNLGTGTLTLGNAAGGSDAATLEARDNSDKSFANQIVLASTTTGTLKIRLIEDEGGVSHNKTFTGGITGTNSLTLENNGGNDPAGKDTLTFSTGAINNVGAITHIGSGSGDTTINSDIGSNVTGVTQNSATSKMVLGGTNTYSGTTTVQAGTLALSSTGLIANTSTIDVQSGATFDVSAKSGYTVGASQTLKGNGTIKGATTISGLLAPGASPGILTFENALTLAGSTVMEIDGIAGAGVTGGHDFVNLTGLGLDGVLSYGGTMTLDIGAIFGIGTYSWNLFDFASEPSGFSGITLADQYSGTLTTGGGGIWGLTSGSNTWSFTESSGVLGLTVIPEPRAALLGGLGMLVLLRRRR